MKTSRSLHDLSASYNAEIDDLTSDSEGHNILQKRLAEKRSQIDFLLMMMDENPEMLAAAFHQGFQFVKPHTFTQLVAREVPELPAWSAIQTSVTLSPWAETLASKVLKTATGAHFLTLTACLEYLYLHDIHAPSAANSDDDRDAEDEDSDNPENEANEDEDGNRDEIGDHRNLEEAGSDWLEQQGFDRKN